MNPAIEAALIAAGVSLVSLGGTIVVAVSGFRNTTRSSSKAIDAGTDQLVRTLDAARDDKLWDKRTQTYEEITAYLLYIQAKRRLEARRRRYRLDAEFEAANDRLLGEYKPASWWDLQGRLVIYGSDEAIAAFEASHSADNEVAGALVRLTTLNQDAKDASSSGLSAQMPEMTEIRAARQELEEARQRADAADQALAKLARAELNRKPSATAPADVQGSQLTQRP